MFETVPFAVPPPAGSLRPPARRARLEGRRAGPSASPAAGAFAAIAQGAPPRVSWVSVWPARRSILSAPAARSTRLQDDLEGCVSESRPEETDEALMTRFQRGDRGAFAVLVRRHQAPLYNFALRQLGGQAAAEDVVQETFVRVAQNGADFKQAARLTTWLYTIARNLCVDALRKTALRRHPSLDEPSRDGDGTGATLGERVADVRSNVERNMLSTQIGEQVVRAILELPEEQREVFLLREVSSLPFREIAEIVGAQENTVKSRMRYALLRLQSALSDLEEYARALR